MAPPYPPTTIANYFLRKASAEDSALTPMQVLKLVYIAHGWNLGYFDGPLINEKVEAWRYGPVIKSLYHALKKYGKSAVRELLPASVFTNRVDSEVDPQTQKLLDKVWEGYGHLSGVKLSQMTHMPGSPWHTVWHPGDSSAPISDDVIRSFYKRKVLEEVEHA